MLHAAADPLVDECGAEGGLEVFGSRGHGCEDPAMFLHADREGEGPPIVLVHGFTQTGRCWGPEAAGRGTSMAG